MKRKILIFGSILIAVLIVAAFAYYRIFHTVAIQSAPPDCNCSVKNVQAVETVLMNCNIELSSATAWTLAARLKRLKAIKPGRYCLKQGMNANEMIREFRSGGRPTLTLRIDDVTSLNELASKLGAHLLNDSVYFMREFSNDSLLNSLGINPSYVSCFIRPNTYDFYWNMTAETFLQRMKKEYDRVWTSTRIEQAQQLSMSPFEVVILASIVKAETSEKEEAPRIAGLYINRLRKGIPLQSDPTTIFGKRTGAKRVYASDLESDSPYNTYKIQGLPPGPINFPEDIYIDAVLQAEMNTYIYMCAEPGGTGRHRFTASYTEHENNRRAYINWLNKAGIR
jgi:UPF0755 protein